MKICWTRILCLLDVSGKGIKLTQITFLLLLLLVLFQKQHHATYTSTIHFTIHMYMYALVILQNMNL